RWPHVFRFGRRIALYFFLQQRERTPRDLGAVTMPVIVEFAALNEMPHQRIGLVGGLRPIPMQRLIRMMLLAALLTHRGDRSKCVWKVIDDAGSNRHVFTGSRVSWQHSRIPFRVAKWSGQGLWRPRVPRAHRSCAPNREAARSRRRADKSNRDRLRALGDG